MQVQKITLKRIFNDIDGSLELEQSYHHFLNGKRFYIQFHGKKDSARLQIESGNIGQ
jgi:hypothetical protein